MPETSVELLRCGSSCDSRDGPKSHEDGTAIATLRWPEALLLTALDALVALLLLVQIAEPVVYTVATAALYQQHGASSGWVVVPGCLLLVITGCGAFVVAALASPGGLQLLHSPLPADAWLLRLRRSTLGRAAVMLLAPWAGIVLFAFRRQLKAPGPLVSQLAPSVAKNLGRFEGAGIAGSAVRPLARLLDGPATRASCVLSKFAQGRVVCSHLRLALGPGLAFSILVGPVFVAAAASHAATCVAVTVAAAVATTGIALAAAVAAVIAAPPDAVCALFGAVAGLHDVLAFAFGLATLAMTAPESSPGVKGPFFDVRVPPVVFAYSCWLVVLGNVACGLIAAVTLAPSLSFRALMAVAVTAAAFSVVVLVVSIVNFGHSIVAGCAAVGFCGLQGVAVALPKLLALHAVAWADRPTHHTVWPQAPLVRAFLEGGSSGDADASDERPDSARNRWRSFIAESFAPAAAAEHGDPACPMRRRAELLTRAADAGAIASLADALAALPAPDRHRRAARCECPGTSVPDDSPVAKNFAKDSMRLLAPALLPAQLLAALYPAAVLATVPWADVPPLQRGLAVASLALLVAGLALAPGVVRYVRFAHGMKTLTGIAGAPPLAPRVWPMVRRCAVPEPSVVLQTVVPAAVLPAFAAGVVGAYLEPADALRGASAEDAARVFAVARERGLHAVDPAA